MTVAQPKLKNIFVCGLSGSGKDTVSNYLREHHGYINLRLAETIKRIITEKRGITFDDLEEAKRQNPDIRKEHNDVSTWLGMNAMLTRLKQISERTCMEFQILPPYCEKLPVCVRDVRAQHEIEYLLEAGYVGLFLERRTGEYQQKEHYTEWDVIASGKIKEYQDKYPKQIIILDNQDWSKSKLQGIIWELVQLNFDKNKSRF